FERNESDFVRHDSLLEYTYAKNLDVAVRNENYQVEVRTNSLGFRDEEWNINPDANNILVLGDSFTAGFGLPKEKRWADIFEDSLSGRNNLHPKIYNAAISGYSLQQMAAGASGLFSKVQPQKVIIGVYLAGLERMKDPYIYFEGYTVRKSQVKYVGKKENQLYFFLFRNEFLQNREYSLLKHSALYNFVQTRIRYLAYNRQKNEMISNNEALAKEAGYLLSELSGKLKDAGAEVIVLPVIQHNAEGVFDPYVLKAYEIVKEQMANQDIDFVDLLPAFKIEVEKGANLWINGDSHWNERAHQLAAEELLKDF
ncbi:MAG: SGNH/GDSL hydrolase family protein, partial [Balneolaceae bacterium]